MGKFFKHLHIKSIYHRRIMLTTERLIHACTFVLLLVGLCTVTSWANYKYVPEIALKMAGVTLSWGIILLVLYLSFKKLDWCWWS